MDKTFAIICDVSAIAFAVLTLIFPREGFIRGFCRGAAIGNLILGVIYVMFVA